MAARRPDLARRLVDLEQQRRYARGARAHGRNRGARTHAAPHLAHVDASGEQAFASRGQVGDPVADAVEAVVALLPGGYRERAGVLERDAAAAEEEEPEAALGELAVQRQPEARRDRTTARWRAPDPSSARPRGRWRVRARVAEAPRPPARRRPRSRVRSAARRRRRRRRSAPPGARVPQRRRRRCRARAGSACRQPAHGVPGTSSRSP